MNCETTALKALAASHIFQEFQNAFHCATGIQIHIEPAEPIIFARDRREGSPLLSREWKDLKDNNLICLDWAPGIFELIIPLQIGEQVLGLLRTGCVMELKLTRRKRNAIFGQFVKGKKRSVRARDLPIIPRPRLIALGKLLCIFGHFLAQMSNRLLLQQSSCESVIVTRAKEYIKENHRETLRLDEVAANSHVSSFYLCKLFKQTTGLNFSDYLVRTRVETAKELLLDNRRRVGEAALDAGFQSLTHFNRVFKRLVGNSPRDFRKNCCSVLPS